MTLAPNPARAGGWAARLLSVLLAAAATTVAAQSPTDALTSPPRGLTDTNAAVPPAPAAPMTPTLPLPAQVLPSTSAAKPAVFGSQLFTGRFGSVAFSGFNPDYVIATGDRVSVRMWGAFTFEAVQVVDVQGNIFIPNVGPISVRGTRNADLNREVESQIKRIFRSNVGVYATLEVAQPVKIFVTGWVKAPGLYAGLSSDSILYYLDRAGGIDPDRGSFLEVEVLRGGQSRARVNLYKFLLEGRIETLQLHDGDTILATPRQHTVQVAGEVLNPYIFEFKQASVSGAELLAITRPRPSATHMSIVRRAGADRRSEYHALAEASKVTIEDGDEVTITSDQYPGTILVRIDGAQLGARMLVLPYGARLQDALAQVKPAPQARLEAVQLYRQSVAARQKELIEVSLRSLETYALTARSATSEEAALRAREAQQMLTFIERARNVQTKGQVVLLPAAQAGLMLLADGDTIVIPEQSNMVVVGGEVVVPSALVWAPNANAKDFIARAGGFTQLADENKLLIMHQDGSVAESESVTIQAGDEIMVLPKIDSKNIEITRAITTIIYQIAIAAKVLFTAW